MFLPKERNKSQKRKNAKAYAALMKHFENKAKELGENIDQTLKQFEENEVKETK